MKRSKRLTPVVDLAIKATEDALKQLGQANAAWQQEKQQLDDLNRYKGEYLSLFRQGELGMLTAPKMLDLRAFLVQLDRAIAAQEQQVANSYKRVEYYRNNWQQKRSKEQAMHTLVDRYQYEELQQELKQERRDNDEHNTSKWVRNPNNQK